MTINGNLLAWIEPCGDDHYIGAFVGEGAAPGAYGQSSGRPPATQDCSSPAEAREWVENQASALRLPIKWISPTSHR
jgi:hypothetical protein